MISHALTLNRRIIRVHEIVAREISVLWSQNSSLWLSASSMQPLQAHLEHPQKKTRPQGLAHFAPTFGNSLDRGTHSEKSCSALRPYSPSLESPFSSSDAPVGLATSQLALADRTAGPRTGRIVLSVSQTPLGLVSDGGQAASSKSSGVFGSSASAGAGERTLLVSGVHDDPHTNTQTYLRLGLRRHSGHDFSGSAAGMDCAAVPFSPHQPVARQPRPTQAQTRRQTRARDSLPAHPSGPGTARWSTPAMGTQAPEETRSATDGISRGAHGGPGVSEADRTFQSLSQIPGLGFAKHHRHCRGHGTNYPRFDAPDSKHQQSSSVAALGHCSDPDASKRYV